MNTFASHCKGNLLKSIRPLNPCTKHKWLRNGNLIPNWLCMCGHTNLYFLLTLRATAGTEGRERHSRLPGNSNWPRVPHRLPLSPNSPLNKSSLVEPPPTSVPFQRGRVTTTAAGPNLCRCSDAGISVSKQPRLTIHPSGGERDFLAWPRGSWLGGGFNHYLLKTAWSLTRGPQRRCLLHASHLEATDVHQRHVEG